MTITAGGEMLRLRPLDSADEQAVRAAQIAMHTDGFEFARELTAGIPWPAYLKKLAREHAGVDLPPERVPATLLIAEFGGVVVGRTSIRHRLSDWLLAFGGHIGYVVLPEFRRRGLATEILRQSVIVARALGVGWTTHVRRAQHALDQGDRALRRPPRRAVAHHLRFSA